MRSTITTYHSNIIQNTLRGAVCHHLERKEKKHSVKMCSTTRQDTQTHLIINKYNSEAFIIFLGTSVLNYRYRVSS